MLDFDTTVKLHIYKIIAETTHAPTSIEAALPLRSLRLCGEIQLTLQPN